MGSGLVIETRPRRNSGKATAIRRAPAKAAADYNSPPVRRHAVFAARKERLKAMARAGVIVHVGWVFAKPGAIGACHQIAQRGAFDRFELGRAQHFATGGGIGSAIAEPARDDGPSPQAARSAWHRDSGPRLRKHRPRQEVALQWAAPYPQPSSRREANGNRNARAAATPRSGWQGNPKYPRPPRRAPPISVDPRPRQARAGPPIPHPIQGYPWDSIWAHRSVWSPQAAIAARRDWSAASWAVLR